MTTSRWSNGAWWFSCNKFTVRIMVESNYIVEAAPVVSKFVGQSPSNLKAWFISFGGFKCEKLV